jgi:hypothetical protein
VRSGLPGVPGFIVGVGISVAGGGVAGEFALLQAEIKAPINSRGRIIVIIFIDLDFAILFSFLILDLINSNR